MAGHRRGVNKPMQSRAKLVRRQEFWRARLESAATPCARVAAAADYLRVSLTRARPEDAERVSRAAATELLRQAEGLGQTGAADDRSAA